MFKRFAWLIILLIIASILLLSRAASFLVVDAPERSDLMLVLAGGEDTRYWRAVELATQGYAGEIQLDADATRRRFGKTDAELARPFVEQTAPSIAEVCPTLEASTFGEAEDVRRCLSDSNVSSILIVTSDLHTRRALSIFQKRLPRYHWSVAATSAPYHFADRWWRNRRWAKATLDEWEKYLWWKLVEQWRSDVVLRG